MDALLACRTCMSSTTSLRYIFIETYGDRALSDILLSVAGLKVVENDPLPNYICEECLDVAKSALRFRILCQNSDAAFRERINMEEKSLIKKELENCSNDVSNFQVCQNSIKVESDSSDFSRLSKNKAKNLNSDMCDLYQCAVCTLRFSSCNLLTNHIKSYHECERMTVDLNDHQDSLCSDEISCNNSLNESDFKHEDPETDNSFDTFIKQKKIKIEPEIVITTSDGVGVPFDDLEENIIIEDLNLDNKEVKVAKKSSKHLKKSNGINKKEKRHRRNHNHIDSESVEEEYSKEFPVERTNFEDKNAMPYSCDKCDKKFRKLLSLNQHIKKHEEQTQKVYSCEQCKREFLRKGHLDNHILTHSSEKGFTCSICPKAFTRQDSLAVHIANHKGMKKHQCNYCEKGFNVLSTLKDHIRTHTGEKPFLCSICGKGFSQSTNLKEHVRRHQGFKPFKCIQCEQTFVSKGELEAHTRKHSGAHPFVCDVCGGGFTTSSSLVKHKRIHTGERPYQCGYCPMRFTALGTLKNHTRRHTGEKPYKCNYCEKAFAQKNDLVSHTRTHTGERPYVCSICGHAFRQSSALKTHYKVHGGIADQMQEQVKLEKGILRLSDTPLTLDAVQLVTNLITVKECQDENSSANLLTPKSETSH